MRELSVILGLVLMVVLGTIAVVWATQGGLRTANQATPTPPRGATPTALAGSPTAPADDPTASASPSPTAPLPTDTASPTTASPSASPSDSPLPSPSASPASLEAEIELLAMGLDTAGTEDEPSQERFLTFTAQGPGRIEATLSNVSFGRVRMCLWQGDPATAGERECDTLRRGTLRRDIEVSEAQTWTVSLIGSQAGASPSADLRLRWPSADSQLRLAGFRFQGEAIDNYNGFVAEVDVAAGGELRIAAEFDDDFGGSYPWLLRVDQLGGSSEPFIDEGDAPSMGSVAGVIAGERYRVTLSNRQVVAEQRVLVEAVLDWP